MYRPILEDILAFTGGKRMMSLTEVSVYVGRESRWVKRHLDVTREGITVHELANKLAKGVKT